MEQLKHIIKSAAKNVWFNRKKYVYFVILLLFLQSLISCILLFNHNNNRNELKYLENEYVVGGKQYHLVLNNLTPEQKSAVVMRYYDFQAGTRYFHPVSEQSITAGNSRYYNLYIYFSSERQSDASPYSLYQSFCKDEVIASLLKEGIAVTETPYLLAFKSELINNSVTSLVCLLVTAIGTLTFGILFNTVVNHFKFSYGVYMTYGANFKKLFSAAISEMLLLNLVTFIPAFLISIGITFLLTIKSGYGIHVILYPMFLALLCSAVLTVISVFVVMRKLSLHTPDRLLRSMNNEGLISSPRMSKRLPDRSFPIKTELLSMKRFWKYIVSLVLTTLIFAGVFCGGAFLMEVQIEKDDMRNAQFVLEFPTGGLLHGEVTTVDSTEETPSSSSPDEEEEKEPLEHAKGYTYNETVREALYAIDGVDYIVKNRSWSATLEKGHILIADDKLTVAGRMNGADADNNLTGFANVDYTVLDEEVVDNLLFKGATITGDISSVINGSYVVAISDTINNARMIKLEVGDTIQIVTNIKGQYRNLPKSMPTSANDILEIFLDSYYFEYTELTIGAIVSDMPVGQSFPLYMNAETFEEITGEGSYFVDVEIYCEEGASESTIRDVQANLYYLSRKFGMTVTNTYQETTSAIQKIKNYPGLILYVSILLLLVSVLIHSLSQSLFYQMRKQEFDIYLCLGSDFKQMKKLFLFDALFFSGLSAIFYSVFALGSCGIVYKIANVNLGKNLMRFGFDVPLWAFFVGFAVAVLSSFGSVMMAYYSYKRESAPVFTGKEVDRVHGAALGENRNEIYDSDAR